MDANDHVWVGDSEYCFPLIQDYLSGGITLAGFWSANHHGVVTGLTVDKSLACVGIPDPCVYVFDSGNGGRVEEYTSTGFLLKVWGDPLGPHEFLPFVPGPIALTGNPV